MCGGVGIPKGKNRRMPKLTGGSPFAALQPLGHVIVSAKRSTTNREFGREVVTKVFFCAIPYTENIGRTDKGVVSLCGFNSQRISFSRKSAGKPGIVSKKVASPAMLKGLSQQAQEPKLRHFATFRTALCLLPRPSFHLLHRLIIWTRPTPLRSPAQGSQTVSSASLSPLVSVASSGAENQVPSAAQVTRPLGWSATSSTR